MKLTDYILAFSLSLGTIFSSDATIHTVDNNPNAPGGVFNSIQLAIDASSNGDSIYVVGSASLYAPFSAAKEIHLFGAGYNPDKQNPYSSVISGYSSFIVTVAGTIITGDASGSTIEGVDINNLSLAGYSATFKLSNITISRCRNYNNNINLASYLSDININNNIIKSIYGGQNSTNIIIANNIISQFQGFGSYINSGTFLCSNNIFAPVTGSANFANIDNTIFANNIFYFYSPNSSTNEYCTFNNNISYGSANDAFNISGTNSGGGNFESVDPLFTSFAGPYGYTPTDDYHLQPSSLGINAGTDGTDIGIYGGAYPWPDGGISGGGFMYSQEADIPQTNQMNVQNAVVPLNGTLNISVKGITNH